MKKDWMIKESELDDDQFKVLRATNDKSLVVTGCAGSGKSVLALIKAQQIQKEKGDNYQVIVYTKALCEFMNSGKEFLGLNKDFFYHKEWRYKRYLKRYANGQSFMVYERDKYGNKVFHRPSAGYTVVDEIQDFNREEILEFVKATEKNFFFFGDTAQSIYDGFPGKGDTVQTDEIPQIVSTRIKSFELYRNYRLPLPVAKVVDYVGVDLPPFFESAYKSPEQEMPRIIRYADVQKQTVAIKELIKNRSDIAILVPNSKSVKSLSKSLDNMSIKHEVKYDNKVYLDENDGEAISSKIFTDNEGRKYYTDSKDTLNMSSELPKLMTYHSAKGLQFETVILPYLEQFSENSTRDRKALYVAMTRTYKELFVLYSGEMPNVLRGIPSELYKKTEMDKVVDL